MPSNASSLTKFGAVTSLLANSGTAHHQQYQNWLCIDALLYSPMDRFSYVRYRFFSNEVERAKLPTDAGPAAMLDESPSSTEMQNMEAEFEQLEREMKEINHNEEALRKQELELSELRAILNKCGQFFNEAETALPSGGDVEPGENDTLLDVDRTGQLR